ncbi:FAD-dependent oxidoreductase [Massilia sp. YIM B02443]|uniref:FAD-dependent oxidoreductase n=1 Tax=Massilia sp. YIM B02443 TaxID=3050127 RepID=UPI0025B6580C|nr:FAD-dependent oxidoreductase [Massilia sp. YIM B02443]MDN4037781.1 FAD-dependent oxidoreductase [Massilia sp. YIM B02443]
MLGATNGSSTSVWMDTAAVPVFPPLAGDLEAGVCVIGAGIAGLTTAYLLAQEGLDVVVIDALGVGAGETGRTTAHFFPPDEWYGGIEHRFGAAQARLVAGSYAHALELVEGIVRREHIDCGFGRLDGYLVGAYAPRADGIVADSTAARLQHERDAAVRAGVAADLLPAVPGLDVQLGPCVRYPGQAQFQPLQYLAGLARAFSARGGRIHGATHAHRVRGDHRRQVVATDRGAIRTKAVVVATHTPFNDRVVMHTKQAGYRTYVVGLRLPRPGVPRLLLWDLGDPYHYVRLAQDGAGNDVLVVGGADHKTGQDAHPAHRYDELERWARARFPMALEVAWRWSGEVMEPADGLPFLGRNPMDDENVYLITGDSGNGMTHCTIGAMLVTDLIMERPNPWSALYDPARKPVHGFREFAGEQANVMARYGEWLTGGAVDSVHAIAPGEGAVLRDGLRRIAVYRDPQGALHALSAKCTHLGCAVHWNGAERSWDCPCHASRFDTEGNVLHGPAPTALARVELRADAAPLPRERRSGARRGVR